MVPDVGAERIAAVAPDVGDARTEVAADAEVARLRTPAAPSAASARPVDHGRRKRGSAYPPRGAAAAERR